MTDRERISALVNAHWSLLRAKELISAAIDNGTAVELDSIDEILQSLDVRINALNT